MRRGHPTISGAPGRVCCRQIVEPKIQSLGCASQPLKIIVKGLANRGLEEIGSQSARQCTDVVFEEFAELVVELIRIEGLDR